MKRLRKFNEQSETESFIEDIKQILMPLIDEGFDFRYKKSNSDLSSVTLKPDSKDEYYEFTLSKPLVVTGFIRFTNEKGYNHRYTNPKDTNQKSLTLLDSISTDATQLNNNIPEIIDRLEEMELGYELVIDESFLWTKLKIRKK